MKHLQYAAICLFVISVFAGGADAQRKSSRRATAKKTADSKSVLPPLDVRAAREKVSNQLANVNNFVNVLGPIAQNIETLDESRSIAARARDRNEANKQNVIAAIRNLKLGLTDLESEFRTKPDLQKYLSSIQGITDLAAQSEDSAIAQKFVASKEPLRAIAAKLTDTLKVLPLSPEL